MTKMLSIIALLLVFVLPLQAGAQERLVLVQQQSGRYETGLIHPARILAIGAGAIIGAVLVGSTINFTGSSLVGAVSGGLIADWWYDDRDDTLSLGFGSTHSSTGRVWSSGRARRGTLRQARRHGIRYPS